SGASPQDAATAPDRRRVVRSAYSRARRPIDQGRLTSRRKGDSATPERDDIHGKVSEMRRVRVEHKPRRPRDDRSPILPLDPRDPEVTRAKRTATSSFRDKRL